MTLDSDSDAHYLRREMDRVYADRLLRLEQNTEELERKVRKELEEIHGSVQKLLDCQAIHEPILRSLDHIVGAGMVMRWIIIIVVGGMAAIGTAATAIEAMRKWLK